MTIILIIYYMIMIGGDGQYSYARNSEFQILFLAHIKLCVLYKTKA